MLPPSNLINHAETRIQRIQVPIQVPVLKPVYVEEPYPVYVPIPGPNRLPNYIQNLTPELLTSLANVNTVPKATITTTTDQNLNSDSDQDDEDEEDVITEEDEEYEEEEEIIAKKQKENQKNKNLSTKTVTKKTTTFQEPNKPQKPTYTQTLQVPGKHLELNNSSYRNLNSGRTFNEIKIQSSNDIRVSKEQNSDTSIAIKAQQKYGNQILASIKDPMVSSQQASQIKSKNYNPGDSKMYKSKYNTAALSNTATLNNNTATLGNIPLARSQMQRSQYQQ